MMSFPCLMVPNHTSSSASSSPVYSWKLLRMFRFHCRRVGSSGEAWRLAASRNMDSRVVGRSVDPRSRVWNVSASVMRVAFSYALDMSAKDGIWAPGASGTRDAL